MGVSPLAPGFATKTIATALPAMSPAQNADAVDQQLKKNKKKPVVRDRLFY